MRRSLLPLVAVVVAAVVVAAAAPTARAASDDLLPDLRMAGLRGIHLERAPEGHPRLRVGTIVINQGKGPFQVRGRRADRSARQMTVRQRIRLASGRSRYAPTDAVMQYQGDGHDHWHLQHFVSLELRAADGLGPTYRLHKIGFCLIDELRWRPSLPYASPVRRFYGSIGCGDPDSLDLSPGISVGWADSYPADFVLQWIDLPDDLRPGRYRLCATVDKADDYRELRDDNNHVWADLDIDVAAGTVGVVARGRSSCTPLRPRACPCPTEAGATHSPAMRFGYRVL